MVGTIGAVLPVVLLVVSRRHDNRRHPESNSRLRPAQTEPTVPRLEVKSVIQHGHIYEIVGAAEPGSAVMINGRFAPTFFEDSTFKYFVGPLPDGMTVPTITARSQDGGFSEEGSH